MNGGNPLSTSSLRGVAQSLAFLVSLAWSPSSWRTLLWLVRSQARQSFIASQYLPEMSWSQEGEDVQLLQILPNSGYYVDVGAHDPFRFSNTWRLYQKGWSGINIDITEGFVERFNKNRPRDTNIMGLVGSPRKATFFRFEEEALNTLSRERAEELVSKGWELAREDSFEVRSLSDIFRQHCQTRTVDLLCIDAEGADYEILQSLDWDEWEISRVLVEVSASASLVADSAITAFLRTKDFEPTHVWSRSCLFQRDTG
jgi:hypothetical protein